MENCRTPVKASSFQSRLVCGRGILRKKIIKAKIKTARINLAAAKVIGGKSSRPILIKNQVVPQIRQSMSQIIIFILQKQKLYLTSLVKAKLSFALFKNAPPANLTDRIGQDIFGVMFDD